MTDALVQPFYLEAQRGTRFCVFHRAAAQPRGAVLYLHPFAEEMNKSRRMAAMQSRMLAAHGYGVLQIDLYGCGDSDGEFFDATWDIWKCDVDAGVRWLKAHVDAPLYLWGLRLGALLALDYASRSPERFAGYLLWQPVVSGKGHLTNFLRTRMAAGLTGSAERTSTHELRAALLAGESVEIGGYELTPELAGSIDALALASLAPAQGAVYWLEVVPPAGAGKSRATQRVVDAWTAAGIDLDIREVTGERFWDSVEITDSLALLGATIASFAALHA